MGRKLWAGQLTRLNHAAASPRTHRVTSICQQRPTDANDFRSIVKLSKTQPAAVEDSINATLSSSDDDDDRCPTWHYVSIKIPAGCVAARLKVDGGGIEPIRQGSIPGPSIFSLSGAFQSFLKWSVLCKGKLMARVGLLMAFGWSRRVSCHKSSPQQQQQQTRECGSTFPLAKVFLSQVLCLSKVNQTLCSSLETIIRRRRETTGARRKKKPRPVKRGRRAAEKKAHFSQLFF